MLKPLHIICLFALLGVGLVSCEKDDSEDDGIFTIKELSKYNPSTNYINYKIYGTIYNLRFDLNGDKIDDVKIHRAGSNVFITLLNSFDIEYSTLPTDTSNIIKPYKLGDKVDSFIGEKYDSYLIYKYDGNAELSYSWNPSTDENYIVFRQNINGNFKYGWIRVSKNQIGPSIMQIN